MSYRIAIEHPCMTRDESMSVYPTEVSIFPTVSFPTELMFILVPYVLVQYFWPWIRHKYKRQNLCNFNFKNVGTRDGETKYCMELFEVATKPLGLFLGQNMLFRQVWTWDKSVINSFLVVTWCSSLLAISSSLTWNAKYNSYSVIALQYNTLFIIMSQTTSFKNNTQLRGSTKSEINLVSSQNLNNIHNPQLQLLRWVW